MKLPRKSEKNDKIFENNARIHPLEKRSAACCSVVGASTNEFEIY